MNAWGRGSWNGRGGPGGGWVARNASSGNTSSCGWAVWVGNDGGGGIAGSGGRGGSVGSTGVGGVTAAVWTAGLVGQQLAMNAAAVRAASDCAAGRGLSL